MSTERYTVLPPREEAEGPWARGRYRELGRPVTCLVCGQWVAAGQPAVEAEADGYCHLGCASVDPRRSRR